MNGEPGHRGLRAGSRGSGEGDGEGDEDFCVAQTADAPHHWGEGKGQLHLRVAAESLREWLAVRIDNT
jgi:hypothetical protein